VEFAHRITMQIMQRFNAEGIDIAFPSQTMYLAGDSKRPVSLGGRPPGTPSTLAVATTPHAVSPAAGAEVEETSLQGGDDGDGDGAH
jgi:MscS family membrane protein